MKRGLKIGLLEDVVAALAMGEPLPEKNKDHAAVIGEFPYGGFSKTIAFQ